MHAGCHLISPCAAAASAGNDEMQIVLEDDALLLYEGDDWLMRLRAVVEQLPNDWEVGGLGNRAPTVPGPGCLTRLGPWR